jgi:CO dehydrogenase flavoprotein C-terminal domain
MSILGTRVVRTEDPRLLTAGGTYTDDLRLPELAGAARVTFVRPRWRPPGSAPSIPRRPGTRPGWSRCGPPPTWMTSRPAMAARPPSRCWPATGSGTWARRWPIVVTEGGYQGEDTAELVSADYEPLPAVASISDALDGGPLLFDGTAAGQAGWSFQKFTKRAIDWAIVGVAVPGGSVALVNMAATPVRAAAAEQALASGASPAEAGALAAEGTSPGEDINATAACRAHLARMLVTRALQEAAARGQEAAARLRRDTP